MRGNNATMWMWHDPASDEEILVMYHKAQFDTATDIPLSSTGTTYGGFTRPDNCIMLPSGTALASFVAADNTGPPSTTREVKAIFGRVRAIFPNAKVISSTWDRFVAEISPGLLIILTLLWLNVIYVDTWWCSTFVIGDATVETKRCENHWVQRLPTSVLSRVS